MADTYKIIRFYQHGTNGVERKVIMTGVTLAGAQKHCRDPETSSSTCTSGSGKARTRKHGPWFDGYEKEA